MSAYSADLRGRVLAVCDAVLSAAKIAARYRVDASRVRRMRQRRREDGKTALRK